MRKSRSQQFLNRNEVVNEDQVRKPKVEENSSRGGADHLIGIEGDFEALDNTPSDFRQRMLAAPVVNKFEDQNKKDEMIVVDDYDNGESSEDDYYDEIGGGGMMMWDDDEDLIPIA